VFGLLKSIQRRVHFARQSGFSEEEPITSNYLSTLPIQNTYCVDIGAQDGVEGSQTLGLFKRGWEGLAVEYDPTIFAVLADLYKRFDKVQLVRTQVTPDNVVSILRSCSCPAEVGFLSLDIDSYDHFILDQILSAFRPTLICAEINETVPPPLLFTVTYDPAHVWQGDHFQGQSISKCYQLCLKHGYEIVELHYNNLFMVPREINKHRALQPEEAYDEGYRNRSDRQEAFPWNADMDQVLAMSKDAAIEFLNRKFAKYVGKYKLE